MTDTINDQISAFIDDELGADESALLVRRFDRDPEARARALRYTLIGSALRGELLEPRPSELRRRVAAALHGAVTIPPANRPSSTAAQWGARFVQPVLGLGIAAAVAIVAIGALRMISAPTPTVAPSLAGTAPVANTVASRASALSDVTFYVVPQDVPEDRLVTPPIRLTNYLMHHSVYASGLGRTSVSSNVVGGAVQPVVEPEGAEPTQ